MQVKQLIFKQLVKNLLNNLIKKILRKIIINQENISNNHDKIIFAINIVLMHEIIF